LKQFFKTWQCPSSDTEFYCHLLAANSGSSLEYTTYTCLSFRYFLTQVERLQFS